MATRVLIIGEDGMLGSKLNLELQKNSNFDIETGNKLTKDKNLFKFDEIVLNSQTKTLSFKFSLDDESFLVDTPKLYFDDMKIK